jgi:hypothetical protein
LQSGLSYRIHFIGFEGIVSERPIYEYGFCRGKTIHCDGTFESLKGVGKKQAVGEEPG